MSVLVRVPLSFGCILLVSQIRPCFATQCRFVGRRCIDCMNHVHQSQNSQTLAVHTSYIVQSHLSRLSSRVGISRWLLEPRRRVKAEKLRGPAGQAGSSRNEGRTWKPKGKRGRDARHNAIQGRTEHGHRSCCNATARCRQPVESFPIERG